MNLISEKKILVHLNQCEKSYDSNVAKQYHGAGGLPEYASALIFLGHNVPTTKSVARIVFLEDHALNALVSLFVDSKVYEVKLVCLHVFDLAFRSKQKCAVAIKTFAEQHKKIASHIDCWPLADLYSSLLNEVLRRDAINVVGKLDVLRRSKNPWMERVGLVSLIYYTTPKKKPFYLGFADLLERILFHSDSHHLYVQKGVGWQLRELGKAFPTDYKKWFVTNGAKLNSIAFSAASEKLEVKVKAPVLAERKRMRACK